MRITLPYVFRIFTRIPISTTTPSKTASLVGALVLSLALAVAFLACEQAEPTPTPTVQPAPTATPTVPPRPTYTETPVPFSSPTPGPTGTPYPTYTPFPTPTPLPTQTPQPTYTPFPTQTPLATYTPFPTFTPTSTYTATATITPTATPTSTPTATVQPTVTSADSTQRSISACSYPKLGVGLEWRICDYETSIRDAGGDVRSQPDLDVERIAVYVFLVEDVYPTSVLDWIATNDVDAGLDHWDGYGVPDYDEYSQWLVLWNAPISLLGPLSRRSDVREVYPFPQPSHDEQSSSNSQYSSNSGWVPTNAPFVHGAELWLNNTPAVDGDRVKVGIIDSGFDGFKQLQMPGDVPSSAKSPAAWT